MRSQCLRWRSLPGCPWKTDCGTVLHTHRQFALRSSTRASWPPIDRNDAVRQLFLLLRRLRAPYWYYRRRELEASFVLTQMYAAAQNNTQALWRPYLQKAAWVEPVSCAFITATLIFHKNLTITHHG